MWVESTSAGTLRLYDRYKGLDGKLHKVSVPLDKDTAQARRKAQEQLQLKIMDKSSIVSRISLNRLVELYLSKKDIKPSTLSNYRSAYGQLIDIIGDVNISVLTAPYVRRRLSESDKAQSTINRYILLLNSLFEWANQFGYMDQIKLKTLKVKEVRIDTDQEYLEAEELVHVLDQLRGSMAYYLCKFLALTGCRIGEAAALTWDDIDDKYVHITKSWKYENGVSTPKTVHSVRDIYIQPELRQLLKEFKEWRLINMMAYGIRTDILFYNARGNYYNATLLLKTLQKLDSPKHLHPHIFRHTHTALLAEHGMSLEAIARRLGHANSNITRQIYFHVTEKLKARDEAALDNISIISAL